MLIQTKQLELKHKITFPNLKPLTNDIERPEGIYEQGRHAKKRGRALARRPAPGVRTHIIKISRILFQVRQVI